MTQTLLTTDMAAPRCMHPPAQAFRPVSVYRIMRNEQDLHASPHKSQTSQPSTSSPKLYPHINPDPQFTSLRSYTHGTCDMIDLMQLYARGP